MRKESAMQRICNAIREVSRGNFDQPELISVFIAFRDLSPPFP